MRAIFLILVLSVAFLSGCGVEDIISLSGKNLEVIKEGIEKNRVVSFRDEDGNLCLVFGDLTDGKSMTSTKDVMALLKEYAGLLGIKSFSEEDIVGAEMVNYADATGFRFQQMYEGIPVIGGEMTVLIDMKAVPICILNNWVQIPANFDKTVTVEEAAAGEAAVRLLAQNTGSTDWRVISAANVIFAPEEGEPIYAWQLELETEIETCSAIVSALDPEKVLFSAGYVGVTATGENSFGESKSFPVIDLGDGYVMYDAEYDLMLCDGQNNMIRNNATGWTVPSEVDLYTNFLTVQQYVHQVLGIDSIDNNGSDLYVRDRFVFSDKKTNAMWQGFERGSDDGVRYGVITFGYNPNGELPFTMCLDICAHEYAHGMMDYYLAGYNGVKGYKVTSRSIGEAYADIFACCVDGNWTIGETYYALTGSNRTCIRSIENPGADYKTALPITLIPDGKFYYYNSTILSHAAYRMHSQYQIPMDDLALIWMNSMRFLNTDSDYQDVRDAVLLSAFQLSTLSGKIQLEDEQFDGMMTVFSDAEIEGHAFEQLDLEKALELEQMPGSDVDGNADIIASGFCNERVAWTLDSKGVLTVSGQGKVPDYGKTGENDQPWAPYGENIRKVVVCFGIEALGWYNFSRFDNLEEVVIADSVTDLGDGTFVSCDSLRRIVVPDSVTVMGWDVFYDCRNLSEVTLPQNLQYLSSHVFYKCTSLERITIPASVSVIGTNCFQGCENLKQIYFLGGMPTIRRGALTQTHEEITLYYLSGANGWSASGWISSEGDVYSTKIYHPDEI